MVCDVSSNLSGAGGQWCSDALVAADILTPLFAILAPVCMASTPLNPYALTSASPLSCVRFVRVVMYVV